MKVRELFELFDTTYQYQTQVRTPEQEVYMFMTEVGVYFVAIGLTDDHGDEDTPVVMFGDQNSRYELTGAFKEKNISPMTLFGTIREILQNSPLIKQSRRFMFFANTNEGSRIKVYERFLKSNNMTYQKSIDDGYVKFSVKL